MRAPFSRRRSLCVAAWLSIVLLVQHLHADSPAGEKKLSREDVLRELAHKVIAPGYAKLANDCRALADSVEKLEPSSDQAALERLRAAWNAAAAAADSLRCFQTGPIADREFVSAFYYWQTIPNRIEAIINDPARAIDSSLLENAGATVKGIHAIEYLLFDRRGGTPGEPPDAARALDLLTASPRRRAYLAALARDLADKAAQLSRDWAAPGAQGAAEKFAAAGQASVNSLVNQLTQSLETTLQNQLNFVLALQPPVDRQLSRIRGTRSGASLQGIVASLEGVEKFYNGENGAGLRDAVSRLNPELAKRVRDKFAETLAATRAIGMPLERAASEKRAAIQNAAEHVHALEILFKVDIAGALGVTITFTSGDSD